MILDAQSLGDAPANLYCDVEVQVAGVNRSTETFIVPVIPDISQ